MQFMDEVPSILICTEAVLNHSAGDVPRIILCVSGMFTVSTLWAFWGLRNTFSEHSPSLQITRLPTGRTLLAVNQHNLKHVHIFKVCTLLLFFNDKQGEITLILSLAYGESP